MLDEPMPMSKGEERGLWLIAILITFVVGIQIGIHQGRLLASSERSAPALVTQAHP